MVTIFTRPRCQPCASFKNWLIGQGIWYEEVDIDSPGVREVLCRHNGGQIVAPTMMHGGRILVGWPGGKKVLAWLEGLENDDD